MMTNSTIYDCSVIELSKVHHRSGNITAIEKNVGLPFEVKRVYYLYDVPGGARRGGHAHQELEQLIVAAGGCFDVIVDDGVNRKVIELNRPYFGLYIPKGIWREIVNFSSGAVCLVIASQKYDKNDYIRKYSEFKKLKSTRNPE